ncbi:AAA family ATPase, partial [Ruegeria sp. HKCCA6837]|uniref:AAA family ATPase n=1 Tax=Ruegeria sp. HKCCA6837 TaxID=2682989 RepID=UPI001489B4FD
MSFINPESFKIGNQLRRAHFTFSRAKPLKAAFSRCLEDQFRSQLIEGVEARGIVVTGNSRVGKSRELKKLINDFNASETQMPDGRPAKVVSCVLSGRVSFKDLGVRTLSALGYEPRRTRTQEYIWQRVLDQAQGQGVVGIHYDECQHVFEKDAKSNRIFLDSFKSMMKEPRWPLMLILSGVSLPRKIGPLLWSRGGNKG